MSDDATDLGSLGFGLMFYNARWYDPALGRFAQADTIIPGGVQGLDRYAYANNNPILYTDPSGHCSIAISQIFIPGIGWISIMPSISCPNDNGINTPANNDLPRVESPHYDGPDMPVYDPPEWGPDVINLGGHSDVKNNDLPRNDSPPALMSTSANNDASDSAPQFGPGFTDDEMTTILDLIADTGEDFNDITFWRGDSNRKDLPALADVGDPNIALNDSFFELPVSRQIYILREELNHTHQSLPNGLGPDDADWLEDDARPWDDYGV
jgi:RHS repeat-associated protein